MSLTTMVAFATSVDHDQTAQDMQSDLSSTTYLLKQLRDRATRKLQLSWSNSTPKLISGKNCHPRHSEHEWLIVAQRA